MLKLAPHDVDAFIDRLCFARARLDLGPLARDAGVLLPLRPQPLPTFLLDAFQLLLHRGDHSQQL